MAKAQWFKFYPDKYTSGTAKFTPEEKGAYIDLLIHQFEKGSIPTDEEEIQEITGVKFSKLKKVLKKFETDNEGKLINIRMAETRKEANAFFEKQASNASSGGRPKKSETQTKPMGLPKETHGKPMANPNETHIDKIRIDKNRVDDDVDNARENFDNAADSYLPTTTIEPYEDIADCMLNLIHTGRYAKAREQICIREHFTVDQLRIRAEMFNEHLTSIGQSTKQMTDYLKHFNYWLPKNAARSQQQQPGKRGLVI